MEPICCCWIVSLHYISLNPLLSHHSSSTVLHPKGLFLPILYFLPVFHEALRHTWNFDTFSLQISQLIPQMRCLNGGIHLRACI